MGEDLQNGSLKEAVELVLVSVRLRMVEKVMYVLWNGVREKLKMRVRENYVLEFLILKSIFHENRKKKMSYFELKKH